MADPVFVDAPGPQASPQFVDAPGPQFVDAPGPSSRPQSAPDYRAMARATAQKYRLDPDRFERQINTESSFNARAVSQAGAQGLGQLMPATAKDLGVKDPFDPQQNLDGAARYMRQLVDRYNGDYDKAAAAYNAGPGAVDSGKPLPQETLDYVRKITGTALKPIDRGVRDVAEFVHKAASDVARGADAILGAPQRQVMGTIEALHKGESPFAAIKDGFLLATHPFDEGRQTAATEELVKLLHMPELRGTDFLSRLGRFGETIAAQALTDPTTLVPLLPAIRRAAMADRGIQTLLEADKAAKEAGGSVPILNAAARAGQRLTQSHVGQEMAKVKQQAKTLFGRRPELDNVLSKDEKAARLRIEDKHYAAAARAADEGTQVLERHGAELKSATDPVDISDEAKADIDRWFATHGKGEPSYDNGDAANMYDAMAAEMKSAAAKRRDETIRQETLEMIYQSRPHMKPPELTPEPPKAAVDDQRAAQILARRVAARIDDPAIPYTQRIKAQKLAREGEWEQAADALGLKEKPHVTARPAEAAAEDKPEKTPAENLVDSLSSAPPSYDFGVPLVDLASRATKTAISLNPFPHGLKNVGILAYLAGGPEAFGRGLAIAMRGATNEEKQWLLDHGVHADYIRDIEGPLKRVKGAKALYAASNTILNRLEAGYRLALKHQLDRKYGTFASNSLQEYKKAAIIAKAIGDYRNVSRFVAALDAIGGPFVAFRLGIVPGAVTRALLRDPQRVEAINRAPVDYNNEVNKGKPSEQVLGGPGEDYDKMVLDLPDYMTSSSTLGLVGDVLKWLNPQSTHTAGAIGDDLARTFIPEFGALEDMGVIKDLTGMGYGLAPGVSQLQALLQSTFGIYSRKKPSPAGEQIYRRREEKAP